MAVAVLVTLNGQMAWCEIDGASLSECDEMLWSYHREEIKQLETDAEDGFPGQLFSRLALAFFDYPAIVRVTLDTNSGKNRIGADYRGEEEMGAVHAHINGALLEHLPGCLLTSETVTRPSDEEAYHARLQRHMHELPA